MKIAVIGSGISGLAASWYLGQDHDVTLCERGQRIGMDTHSVEVETESGSVYLNAPMRVFFEGYYPTLSNLYREINVAFEPVNYSGSLSQAGSRAHFHYRNYWLGNFTLPFLAGRSLTTLHGWQLGAEISLFLRRVRRLDVGSLSEAMTFGQYLEQAGCSERLTTGFLLPALAGICTCSYERVASYPAVIILGYLSADLTWSRVNRLTHGVRDVASRLSGNATEIRCDLDLKGIERLENGIEIRDGKGYKERFDHVVIATQADQARRLLPESMDAERALLGRFDYEGSRLLTHNDSRLAPQDQRDWAPVNFLLSKQHDKPMASIWMNSIYPELANAAPVFETWNPHLDVDARDILIDAWVERPVVTTNSLDAIRRLESLQEQPDRRIWFCGSYAYKGIPLLESAVVSSQDVARKINAL